MKKRMSFAVAGILMAMAFTVTGEAKPKKNQNPTLIDILEDLSGTEIKQKKHRNKSSLGDLDSWGAIQNYLWDYQKSGKKGLPPGLVKKVDRGESLPPGWQKKLYPGGTFPGNLFSLAEQLNYSSIPGFGIPKKNEGFYALGNRIYKVYQPTRKILNMMQVD